jgi:hypothetical protein
MNRHKRAEVINSLNPKKSSDYNLIAGKILTDLPILKIHTQTSSPLTQECLNVVSLVLYFTSSTLLTYQPPQTTIATFADNTGH